MVRLARREIEEAQLQQMMGHIEPQALEISNRKESRARRVFISGDGTPSHSFIQRSNGASYVS